MTKFLTILLLTLVSFISQAEAQVPFDGETEFKIIDVLQGDAGTFVNRKGTKSAYFHLAGCSTYSPDTLYGREARDYVNSQIAGKLVEFQFLKGMAHSPPTNHYLVTVRINNVDICAQLLKKGLAMYVPADENFISGILASTYETNQRKAKYSGTGLWKTEERTPAGAYVISPESRYKLQTYRYSEQYYNGAVNPSLEGFNRPRAEDVSDAPVKNKDPNDWRKPVYNK
jgi:hypothetical protein